MPFLIDQFIKTSANSSFLFDFEGSNDENLARFYKSFGAHKSELSKFKNKSVTFIVKVYEVIFNLEVWIFGMK